MTHAYHTRLEEEARPYGPDSINYIRHRANCQREDYNVSWSDDYDYYYHHVMVIIITTSVSLLFTDRSITTTIALIAILGYQRLMLLAISAARQTGLWTGVIRIIIEWPLSTSNRRIMP